MRIPNFVGGTYESASAIAAGEECINFFSEQVPVGGKTRSMLVSGPGITTRATSTEAPCRGLFQEDGRAFGVYGATLYEISSTYVFTSRGTITNDGNPVTMDTNGDAGGELFIVGGDTGYVFTLATNVLTTEVTDVTFGGQIDGFFLALDHDTSTLKISESLDGTTWDGTQIAQRTAGSDPWHGMTVIRREAVLIGEYTGEVFFNNGASPFPFALRPGSFFEVGIKAHWSLARFGTTCAWLGQTRRGGTAVYWLNGYIPEPISTPGIEWLIQSYEEDGDIGNAVGWTYDREGHSFYVLEFPTQNKTLVYDATTNQWHRRGLYSSNDNDFLTWRPRWHCKAFDRNLVGDGGGAGLYSLSSTVYTDVGGAALRRVRRSPHLSAENVRLFFEYFELECDRGVGTTVGQGVDPLISLRYSDDGGKTWSDARTRELGALGKYDTRVRWDMCGSGRDRVWEISVTDPVAVRIMDAFVGVTRGIH